MNHAHDILEAARFAPSVHNTQPWKVEITDDGFQVSIDSAHILIDGDPTGRETMISLGIFSEAIIASAADYGYTVQQAIWNNSCVDITFDTQAKGKASSKYTDLLHSRVTDRSIYKKVIIAKQDGEQISQSVTIPGVTVWLKTDETFINHIARLTSQGIRIALSSPGFRHEISNYLVQPWSGRRRGFSVKSLRIPLLAALFEPLSLRLGIGLNKEARLEKKRWQSASGIVCITTEGDLHEDWFNAGRAYLQASLAIEQLGLSQATSAATVEASTFHEDIEEALQTKQRLQCVIRIGTGSTKKVHSSRISVDELLTTSNYARF